jgi:hypothetical protein
MIISLLEQKEPCRFCFSCITIFRKLKHATYLGRKEMWLIERTFLITRRLKHLFDSLTTAFISKFRAHHTVSAAILFSLAISNLEGVTATCWKLCARNRRLEADGYSENNKSSSTKVCSQIRFNGD